MVFVSYIYLLVVQPTKVSLTECTKYDLYAINICTLLSIMCLLAVRQCQMGNQAVDLPHLHALFVLTLEFVC